MDWATRAAHLKSLVWHQQSLKYKSSTINTMWQAPTTTFSMDRWISAYLIVLTIMGKLHCSNKKIKEDQPNQSYKGKYHFEP
jgi:hypothetical protein